jgi:hypothetical protein
MTTTITKRISAVASGGQTSRVIASELTSNLLLLEGDESGYLLLEGDEQSDADKLMLEGDEAEASLNTRRITGTPVANNTNRVTI